MTRPPFTDRSAAETAAERLRVLAHPARLLILGALSAGERSVADIEAATGLKQPGLSQQLGELRQADLVQTRREGRSVHYRLAGERVQLLVVALAAALAENEADVASLREALTAAPANTPRTTAQAAVFARTGKAFPHRVRHRAAS